VNLKPVSIGYVFEATSVNFLIFFDVSGALEESSTSHKSPAHIILGDTFDQGICVGERIDEQIQDIIGAVGTGLGNSNAAGPSTGKRAC
jgi:hypothetical protein